jgi:hypothetical protein
MVYLPVGGCVVARAGLARQAEDSLADDRPLDLVGAAGDRDRRHRQDDLGHHSAERRIRPGQHGPRPGDHRMHPCRLAGDAAAGQLAQ